MAVSRASPLPMMVGRERELARGARLVDDALAGRGALLLISGEAGIGKTALAEAISRAAAVRGAAVRIGRCYDLTETPPYGPWIELLAQFPAEEGMPPLPAVVTRRVAAHGASSRAALFAAVRAWLAAAASRQPLVLVLDDLHWADGASLDLMHVLARQIAPLPILLIATYRDDELLPGHPLAPLLPALVRESGAARLDLRRLDHDAVRALVAARYAFGEGERTRLVAYLRDRTDGNPLFIGEMLRTLEEEAVLAYRASTWTLGDLGGVRVPALLRHVIDRRIERLGEAARDLLALAAVIGQEVPLALWCAAAGTDERGLLPVVEQAIAARLLEAAGASSGDLRFTHALIRQALYEATTPPQRRISHRQVGELLAATPAPDPDAVGYHFRQAGDRRAAAWLIRAGERAQQAYAWQAAIERFEVAASLMEQNEPDARARGWLLIRLAWLRRFSHPQKGMASLDGAARIAVTAHDDALAAYAAFYRGIVHYHRGDIRRGLAEMVGEMAALDALAAMDDRMATVPADILAYAGDPRGTLVGFLAGTGQYTEAIRTGERTARGAVPGAEVSHGLGIAYAGLGRPDTAAAAFARAREGYQALGQALSAGEGALDELRWLAIPFFADRPTERAQLAIEAEDAWTRAQGALDELPPRLARLPALLLDGDWQEARRIAMVARSTGIYRNLARSVLGPLARAQGESDLAWAVIHEDLPAGPASAPGDTYFPTALILLRLAASLALDGAEYPLARAWLEAHDRWIDASGAVVGRAEGALGWAAYHRATGETDRAYAAATTALAQATAPRQPLALLAAHRMLGVLDADAGRVAEASVNLDMAVALAERCAAPYERALSLAALATVQDGRAAETTLLTAQEIARTLGARPLLWQTHRALGDHYHRRNRYADAERAYLAAQRIIADLAAGQSDRAARGRFLDASMASIPPVYRSRGRKTPPGSLTTREHEVVAQIAQGKSNREIAEALFIAEKTVEMHVSNSLGKLGFHSRSQLAVWAAEQSRRS
jgi:DNA-binding CsgD family transcriptional regulator